MANGVKRTALQEPKSRNKKTKTAASTGRPSYTVGDATSPEGEADDEVSVGTQTEATVKQTIDLLQNVRLQDSNWPKVFGKRLNDNETALLEKLADRKQELRTRRETFKQHLLPVLRDALSPIDDREAPEDHSESILTISFIQAGHQDSIIQLAKLLTASNNLIDTFRAARKYNETETPPSRVGNMQKTCEKDKEAALAALDAGRSVAARDIEVMMADRSNEVRGRSRLDRESEMKGRAMLLRGEEEIDDEDKENRVNVGWGIVAQDVEKVVRKFDSVGR